MNENEVAKQIVDAAFLVHTTLGPGLLESAYRRVMEYELRKRGFQVEQEYPVPVIYDGVIFDEAFKADLMVENLVIVELKSVETIAKVHKKQLLTYLKIADKRLGLLINFNERLIKDGITRIANSLPS
jgi:GxxExxY protein